MQTRKHSAIESVANVVVGYLVAVGSQVLIFPFFDIDVSIGDNFLIGLWFTVVSLARSFCLRRIFTRWTENVG